MQNIIIFEGQDRCLKSTIINRIIQTDSLHSYHHLHYGKPPKGAKDVQAFQEQTYTEMFDIISKDASFILDRSHIGEMIWSPIYRNYDSKPFIQKLEREWYEKEKETKNISLFILVDSNFERWSKRDDRQGLNNGSLDKHLLEIERFKSGMDLTCIENKHFYDLSKIYRDRFSDDADPLLVDDELLFVNIMQHIILPIMEKEAKIRNSKEIII
jgi:hypothetical protein